MQPGERLARFEGLAGREFLWCWVVLVGAPAPSEEMDRLTTSNAKPQVVGRAFVGELAATRQWIVHREAMLISEDRPQDPMGGVGLDCAMQHLLKIRYRGGADAHHASESSADVPSRNRGREDPPGPASELPCCA